MNPRNQTAGAAARAPLHLQMRIDSVSRREGEATVTGAVVRVFRGDPAMTGQPVSITLLVADTDDWAPDDFGRFPPEAVRAGRIVEAHLRPGPDGLEVVADLVGVYDASSDTPKLES